MCSRNYESVVSRNINSTASETNSENTEFYLYSAIVTFSKCWCVKAIVFQHEDEMELWNAEDILYAERKELAC